MANLYFDFFIIIMDSINRLYVFFPILKIFRYFFSQCSRVRTDYYFMVSYEEACVEALFLRHVRSVINYIVNNIAKMFLELFKENSGLVMYLPYIIIAYALFSYINMLFKIVVDVRYTYVRMLHGKKAADKL